MVPIIAIVVIVAFIGGLIWLTNVLAAKRSRAFAEAAQGLGFGFERGPFAPGGGSLAALSGFPVCNQGYAREVRNLLTGRVEDCGLQIFDYSYTTGSGKQRATFSFTAALIAGTVPLPTLSLYPENIFSKIGAAFGGQDIDFPEYPEFSRCFVLKATDEAQVRAMMDPPTAAFFEAHRGITVDAANGSLLFRRANVRVKPLAIRQFLDEALLTFRTLSAAAARVRR